MSGQPVEGLCESRPKYRKKDFDNRPNSIVSPQTFEKRSLKNRFEKSPFEKAISLKNNELLTFQQDGVSQVFLFL
jgi:hypothetical protein